MFVFVCIAAISQQSGTIRDSDARLDRSTKKASGMRLQKKNKDCDSKKVALLLGDNGR
jgi:hypothetical protein